ncbi:MAG TPA: ATP-binding protein, partial [Marmoricola sp.]
VSGFADDITLLAAQRRPPPPALHVEFPATVDSLRPALAALMQWLEQQRVGSNDLMALAHAVGELVSNVIDHAYHLVEGAAEEIFTLRAVLTGAGDAEVEVADGGAWREPERPADRGRGLAMASGLVDHLELDRRREGTTARAIHRLHRPVELFTDTHGGPASGRPPPGELTHRLEGNVLAVSGPVDQLSVDAFRSVLRRASVGGSVPVVVDLGGVTRLASAGVQALLEALDEGPGAGTANPDPALRLLAPVGSPAQHVLEVVGLRYDAAGPAPGDMS